MAVDQVTLDIRGAGQASNSTLITSSTTPTVDVEAYGSLHITALAGAITVVNVVGTPNDMQRLVIRAKDNGTARAVTLGAQFEPVGVALPTTTTVGKRGTWTFYYDSTTAKWGCVSVITEA